MKGFNGSKLITNETRKKMSISAKRTNNGFKKGHLYYEIKDKESFRLKMRAIALADGRKPDFTGHRHSEESKKIMSEKTKANPNRYWLGKDRAEIFTPEYRKKMSKSIKKIVESGKHNFWKGGITPKNKIIRSSTEYKQWRKAVFERDNYTCQFCKVRGGELNADHIKPFALFSELRFELSNGRTLCHSCHLKTDTYGNKAKKLSTVSDFIVVAELIK